MDKSGILDGVLPFTYELILSFFIDESVTGIDYSVKTQLVVGKGESFQPSMYAIFKVKDEKKFIELIEKEANATIVEKEGMKTAIKESDGYALVWNEEFAVMSNIPIDIFAMLSGKGGAGGDKTVNKLIELIKSADEAEVNTTYADFLKKDADLSIHYDGKGMFAYMKDMMGENSQDIDKMRDMYEGMVSDMFINFKEGRIDIEMINHFSDKLKEQLSFIKENGIDDKLLSYGNSANPLMTGGYNVDFTKFFEYLESQMTEEVYAEFEGGLTEMGLTVEDAKKSLTGGFVYIIDGIVEVEEIMDFGYGEPYTYTTTMPVFGVAMGVADASALKAILADSLKMPNGIYNMGDAFVYLDGDVLFATNDSAWANKVVNKQTVSIANSKETMAANPLAIFMDFSAIAALKSAEDGKEILSMLSEFSGGANIDGGSFSLKLNDSSKNSLRILTEAIASILDRMEKESNKELEAELEEIVNENAEGLEDELQEGLDELEEKMAQ